MKQGRKASKSRSTPQKTTTQRARVTWRDLFLAQLRINGNITRACQVADIERSTAYRAREKEPAFAQAWDEALETAWDRLEEEAYRRAHEGTVKGVYYKGKLVAFENEYSDNLLTLLLKGNRPEKFADKLIIKVTQEQADILKQYGLSASEAFERLIQNLHEADSVKNEVSDG